MNPEYTPDITTQEVGTKAALLNISGKPESLMELVYWAQRRAIAHTTTNEEVKEVAEKPDCWCRTCRPITMSDMRMVVCPTCGNKRCPRATNHLLPCTSSNEPGQPGSAYGVPLEAIW